MKRNRTLTGCSACRSRHVKCDELEPECKKCQAVGLQCPGYLPRLIWKPAFEKCTAVKEKDEPFSRRPLFSGTQQKTMTEATLISLAPKSVNKALESLDTMFDKGETTSRDDITAEHFKGPFGVLRFSHEQRQPPPSITPGLPSLKASPGDTGALAPVVNESDQPADLLIYFKRHIGTMALAVQTQGNLSPWRTVHLPVAEHAHRQLQLGKDITCTEQSLYHSLLAATCFHHGQRKTASSAIWTERGNRYKEIARQELELGIQDEVMSHGQNTYEELLIGLLSVALLEIQDAKYCDAEYLLVEAEYLIRSRGLSPTQKSLQIRSLHHLYTYLRIIAESTCGCALRSMNPSRPRAYTCGSGSKKVMRSFRIADHSTESDLNIASIKCKELAHDDIHLEVLGQWEDSLFLDLFGLPENLLGLLSQTVRLANEQELIHKNLNADKKLVENLMKRTKLLEHSILSWKLSSYEASQQNLLEPRNRNAVQAFHQGVILFYYRRVQNINAIILQDTVRKLLDYVQVSDYCNSGAAIVLWPCFIAACEALQPELRVSIGNRLACYAETTRKKSFEVALSTAKRVWELRDEKQDFTIGWFDVNTLDRSPIIVV